LLDKGEVSRLATQSDVAVTATRSRILERNQKVKKLLKNIHAAR